MMFRAFFLVSFFLFFSLGCFAKQNMAQENISASKTEEADPNVWDFGKVKEGQVSKHAFILKNESAKPLSIKEVSTSCGCAASEVKKRELAPGESTSIEVSFDSKGYEGATQQYIYVQTDSLDNPVIRFTIKADVCKQSKGG